MTFHYSVVYAFAYCKCSNFGGGILPSNQFRDNITTNDPLRCSAKQMKNGSWEAPYLAKKNYSPDLFMP